MGPGGVEPSHRKGRSVVEQQETPLFSALRRHAEERPRSYHVPGHKGGRAAWPGLLEAWGERVFPYDATELESLDDLHAPSGVILEAEQLASRAFGAQKTCFLTGGATAGIIGSVLACCRPGDPVLLPRNVHRSVIAGLILADARPVFMKPEFDELTGAYSGLEPRTLAANLAAHPQARLVVLVNPTYYGACGDLAGLVACARDRGVPVLVDEAHGSHFPFWSGFPGSGLAVGADLVVHGVHKTLGALTGGAMVHLGRQSRVTESRLRSMLRLVHTTSPSYLVLASLDAARHQAASRTGEEWTRVWSEVQELRRSLEGMTEMLPHPLPLPRPGYVAHDPFRVVLVSSGRWKGQALARELTQRGYYPELSEENHVLLVMGLDPGERAEKLASVVAESLQTAMPGGARRPGSDLPGALPIPVLSPRQAALAPSRPVPLKGASGYVAGEMLVPYPPGTVAVCPGELIDTETAEWLWCLLAGGRFCHGVGPPPDYPVSVVAE